VGGRKDPVWRVVVADQRSPRDGRIIETVGQYNAQTEPSTIVLKEDRIREVQPLADAVLLEDDRGGLDKGAQPTDTVRKILRTQGISAPTR